MSDNPSTTTYVAYIGNIAVRGLTKERLFDVLLEKLNEDFFIYDLDFEEYGGVIYVYRNEEEAKDDCGLGINSIATVYEEEKS